ncbi:probable serine threonine- kinase DDB_G0271538 [Paramuricea clavata]|uniref:Probable serine threonine- kinase DDB_G0271538 n=1 Tax=Paramuricea clavata TaxID=317549 RepID=A0A7D9D5J4_PARCT|nr:probable serine threonine- kinase DDB_G0271538 [Paramuricea clavata]
MPTTCIVGAGSYGQCVVKRFTRLGIEVIEKKLHEGSLEEVYREAHYMQLFSHRCVPHLLGIQFEDKPFSIVMEFVGENLESITIQKLLYDKLKNVVLSTNDCFQVCYDIVDALHHLHQIGYLHCDLKANNVLVHKKKGYLVDFGKVKKIPNKSTKRYTKVYPHIAPEVLNGEPASPASDIYSMGKIILSIGDNLKNDHLLSLGKLFSDPEPSKRPTVSELMGNLKSGINTS